MDKTKKVITSSLVVIGLLMNACGDSDSDNDTTAEVTKRSVSINFDAVVGDEDLVCSENGAAKVYENLGTSNASASIADFRYFVSEVKLKMEDGTTQTLVLENNNNQYYSEVNGSVAILDFEDNTGNCINRGNDSDIYTTITGEIETNSEITGVEFTVGVPFELNHIEFPTIPALTKSSMSWSWASGRKFTKLEVNPVDSNNTAGDIFNFHLGSTSCSDADSDSYTDECIQANRVLISFDDFDPETQEIVIDYAQLLANVDIVDDQGYKSGCMSFLGDPECQSMFSAIGLDYVSEDGSCLNGDCTESQSMFSVKTK